MAKSGRSIDEMDQDMKGLGHNGMLQRQWKMLKQVLERNDETETAPPDEASNDASEEADKTEKSKP